MTEEEEFIHTDKKGYEVKNKILGVNVSGYYNTRFRLFQNGLITLLTAVNEQFQSLTHQIDNSVIIYILKLFLLILGLYVFNQANFLQKEFIFLNNKKYPFSFILNYFFFLLSQLHIVS